MFPVNKIFDNFFLFSNQTDRHICVFIIKKVKEVMDYNNKTVMYKCNNNFEVQVIRIYERVLSIVIV